MKIKELDDSQQSVLQSCNENDKLLLVLKSGIDENVEAVKTNIESITKSKLGSST